jgi:hypothetical protein
MNGSPIARAPETFVEMRELVRSTVISLNKLRVAIRPDHDGLQALSSFDVQLHLQRHATRLTMPLGVVALHLQGLGFERTGGAESARFLIKDDAFRALLAGVSTEQKET